MALELQQEKKAQAERERRLKEQEQKIENLSTMVINSAVDDRDLDRRNKKVSILSDVHLFSPRNVLIAASLSGRNPSQLSF